MNRRQAIKTGITATAAILTITGCKSKPEPLTVKRLCETRDVMKAKERYGRSPGLEAFKELSTFDKLALLPREYHNDNTSHTAYNNHLYACNPKEPAMLFTQGQWEPIVFEPLPDNSYSYDKVV